MAFISIGQKYGFVSIGDSIRRQVAEGEARGEQKGRDAERREMAKNMKAWGDSTEKIMAVSGLSQEEIEAL